MIRGLTLKIIQEVDSELSAELHRENNVRPYAVTNAFFPKENQPEWVDKKYILNSSTPLWFKFKTINQQVTQSLIQGIVERKDEPLILDGKEFELERVQMQTIHYSDKDFFDNPLSGIFYIDFISPTQFTPRKLPGIYVFPQPQFVFGNLLNLTLSLQLLTEQISGQEFQDYIAKSIYVRHHRIRTKEITMGKLPPMIGYIGRTEYVIENDDHRYSSLLPVLVKVGEIINVGKKRTAGFGEIRGYFYPISEGKKH